jgi:hypothetical protein
MSIKTVLGLEAFPITEEQVIKKIKDAQNNNLREVEFTSGGKTVKLRLSQTQAIGMMTDWHDYY